MSCYQKRFRVTPGAAILWRFKENKLPTAMINRFSHFSSKKSPTFPGFSSLNFRIACFSFIFMIVFEESLGFGLFVKQKKHFEDATLSFRWAFLKVFSILLVKWLIHESIMKVIISCSPRLFHHARLRTLYCFFLKLISCLIKLY